MVTGHSGVFFLTCRLGDAHPEAVCIKGLRPRSAGCQGTGASCPPSVALRMRSSRVLGTHTVLGQHLGPQDLRPLLAPGYSQNGVTNGHKVGQARTLGGPGTLGSLRWAGLGYGHSPRQDHCKDLRGDRESRAAFLHLVGVPFECPHSESGPLHLSLGRDLGNPQGL